MGTWKPTGSTPTFCGRLHSNCQEFVFLQVHSHLQGNSDAVCYFEMTFLMPSSGLAASLSSEHSSPERYLVPMYCTSLLAQGRTRITILKPCPSILSSLPHQICTSTDSLNDAGQVSRGKGTHISLAVQCGPTEIKVGLLPLPPTQEDQERKCHRVGHPSEWHLWVSLQTHCLLACLA